LLLRDWLFEEIGPPYMWTVMLSVVEWEHLTDDQKELHNTMRESWLSRYSKTSHTVLQHWLWRFLKKQTESFAPLHKVFSKIKVDSPDSGTSAWTEIFLLYPVTSASIAHKLLARGLKTCLNFKNDSMVSALDYIASVKRADTDIDGFSHSDAGPALMQAAAKYPEEPPPMTTPRDFFLFLCLVVASGIFLRRALYLEDCCFAFVFLCVCVWRARSTSFRYQMVLPFV
jgi:hypothetical protein